MTMTLQLFHFLHRVLYYCQLDSTKEFNKLCELHITQMDGTAAKYVIIVMISIVYECFSVASVSILFDFTLWRKFNVYWKYDWIEIKALYNGKFQRK